MKKYRIVVYDQEHKVSDAKAFDVSDETEKVYITVEDKRFELILEHRHERLKRKN